MRNQFRPGMGKVILISLIVALLLSGCSVSGIENANLTLNDKQTADLSSQTESDKKSKNEKQTNTDTTFQEEVKEEDLAEFDKKPEEVEPASVMFDPAQAYLLCFYPRCAYDRASEGMIFTFSFEKGIPVTDDDNVYLFEFATFEDELSFEDKIPIASVTKQKDVTFEFPFKDRHLFARFVPAVMYKGEYVGISTGRYIENPGALAQNTEPYWEPESKKGLLLDANTVNTEWLTNLDVKRVVYNLPLSLIMGETQNETYPTVDFVYNGKTYKFDGYNLAGFDTLFTYLTSQGYHTTVIILNDWNKEFPEMMHPLSRVRTGKSMYYAFNTQEEEGVREMEAAALFLADRYTSGEYGVIEDWVIANEINQQKIWNYMATNNLDYFVDSFEKSFRTFYNAIKSGYANAHICYSIDHDWNDNNGANGRFFNGKDVVTAFSEKAKLGGDYDWGLSLHPYPNPLPRVRFWNGKFDKTENASVVTPMNLSALTDFMQKPEFLSPTGKVRNLSVTELGFSSRVGEKVQAAAFAYCYFIIEDNEHIDSFLLNRQTDDTAALRSGLALGIYNNDYSSKRLAEVFKYIDNPEVNEEYYPEMLEIIGYDSLEEALEAAR